MSVGPFPLAKPGSVFWNSTEGQPTLYYVLADGTWAPVFQIAIANDGNGAHYTGRRFTLPQEMISAGWEIDPNGNLLKLAN
jgi:hypothetical protein